MTIGAIQPMDQGWLGDAHRSLRVHLGFSILVLAYVLTAVAVAAALDDVSRLSIWRSISFIAAMVVVIAVCHFIVRAYWIVFVARPAQPGDAIVREWSRYLTRRRLFNAVPVIVLLSAFMAVFISLKHMIPLIHPYDWDATFMAWDTTLHGGIPPWRLLQPILGYPIVTGLVSVIYGAWGLVIACCCFWQAFTDGEQRLRMQFLVTFVLCFALLGNVAATWLASGGPCFYGHLVAGQDPYEPLMNYLHLANQQVPLNWSFVAQDILWQDYASGALDVGNGISAMPSLHVGGATLCALLGCRTNKRLGIALSAYAVIIMIGSVHLGWHYAIDGYVAVLGTLAIWWAVGAVLSLSGTLRLPDFRFRTDRDCLRPLTPRR
jgi:PAP2 superfamily